MSFHTPHGSARYRLPWSWSSFDYRELCRLLRQQSDARFEIAKVEGRTAGVVHSDRGDLSAPLIVDALGWRRVLGRDGYQPPEAPLSRGLEVHPEAGGRDLDVWIDRSLLRRGYCWSVPADGRAAGGRRVVRAAPPREGANARVGRAPGGRRGALPGQLVPPSPAPRRLRRGLLRGRLGRALLPVLGRGHPHRLLLRASPAAASCVPCSMAAAPATRRCGRYAAFSAGHRRAFGLALALQRLIPALPPRLLTARAQGLRPPGRDRPLVRVVPGPGPPSWRAAGERWLRGYGCGRGGLGAGCTEPLPAVAAHVLDQRAPGRGPCP